MKLGINENISNEKYHGDRTFYSSSALKLILNDREAFHKKYILNVTEPEPESAALNFGTVAHLKVLEPELYEGSVIVFDGPVRRGKAFEEFKKNHDGKLIITLAEDTKLKLLSHEISKNEFSKLAMQNSLKEHTLGGIFNEVHLKVRCDAINVESGAIYDLKTTGYASGIDNFRDSLQSLDYDLSAYMYCLISKQIYNKPFDFYFLVFSKSDHGYKVYKASKDTLLQGKLKFESAIETLKHCLLTNDWTNDILVSDDNEIQEV